MRSYGSDMDVGYTYKGYCFYNQAKKYVLFSELVEGVNKEVYVLTAKQLREEIAKFSREVSDASR